MSIDDVKKITKKVTPKKVNWKWVVLVLLLVAGIYYLLTPQDDIFSPSDFNDTSEESEKNILENTPTPGKDLPSDEAADEKSDSQEGGSQPETLSKQNIVSTISQAVKGVTDRIKDKVKDVIDNIPGIPPGQAKKYFDFQPNGKKDFSLKERPSFKFKTNLKKNDFNGKVKFRNAKGKLVDLDYEIVEDSEGVTIELIKGRQIKPGKFTIEVDLSSFDMADDKKFSIFKSVYAQSKDIFEQDFTWGVLALNLNKSIYASGENADISIGVLDDRGEMVCDAAITLTISDPNENETVLSRANGGISVNSGCHTKELKITPDFEADYTTGGVGNYQMTLTATSDDGDRTIVDNFEVRASVPFDVERTAATRIYPRHIYPVEIDITVNEDFNGTITESVSSEFAISQSGGSVTAYDRTSTVGDTTFIEWDVDLSRGDDITLGYSYDAPDISPNFFVTGPLEFDDGSLVFEEIRQWQVAVDGIGQIPHVTVFTDTNDESADAVLGTYYDVANTTISDASFDVAGIANGDDILIIADINVEGNNANQVFGFRLADTGGTAIANTTIQREVRTSNDRNTWQRIMTKTTRPTDMGIVMQKATLSSASYNSHVHKAGITVISLENLTVNDDYVYGESTSTAGIPANGSPQTFATITTPSGDSNWQGEVLVLDHWVAAADAVITDSLIHHMVRDTDTPVNSTSQQAEDLDEQWGGGSQWVYTNGDTSSHTYNVQLENSDASTDAFDHVYSSIIAFRASLFEDFEFNQATAQISNTQNAWNEAAGITPFTPETADDFFISGFVVAELNTNASDGEFVRLQVDGSNVPSGYVDTTEGAGSEVSTDDYSLSFHSVEDFSLASKDIDMDVWTDESGHYVNHRSLVALSFELAGDSPRTDQFHYRWRDDTVDLNTSGGFLAAEDTVMASGITKNQTYRLRMEVANTGTLAESSARTYELQWGDRVNKSTCAEISTWTGVADSTDEFEMVATSYIDPDGESTTSGILANSEGYTRVSGEGRESADTTGSIGPLSSSYYTELEYAISATDDAVTGRTYCFRLYDTTGAESLDRYSKYPSVTISSVSVTGGTTMEWGTEAGVSDDSWSTINFDGVYTNPVFICTVQYANTIGNESINNADTTADADSIVCRAQNVGSTSAQVRLQEPGASDVSNETVHWMVVEEGVYDTDDIKMEAFTYTSTITNGKTNGWSGQSQSYAQSYTNPVVLAQVMTYNDSGWSVGFCKGSAQADPPDSSHLECGKHVGEDTDTTRSDETIGIVVIEQGSGTLGTNEFEAWAPTGATIDRIDDSTTDAYTFNSAFSTTPEVAILSQAGISGGDGPHPALYGASPLSTTGVKLQIMEDEIGDSDQGGNTENVHYVVFEAAGSYSASEVAFDQTTYRFYDNADSVQPGNAQAAENTAVTGVDYLEVLRLRSGIQVGLNNLSADSFAFKLQYGEGTTCSSIGTWYDVGAAGSGTIWRGYDNTPADGATITSSLLNSQTNALQSYEEQNNSVNNPNAITKGSRGEWDWVIQNNGATASTDYCFRTVMSDDSVIQYTHYPQLTTAPYINVSGKVYQSDEASFIGNPPCDDTTSVISLRVDGGTERTTTCTNGGGSADYLIPGVTVSDGSTISIYLNSNSTPKANLVTIGEEGVDITNANLFQNAVIVQDNYDGTVTNAEMEDWDNDDDSTNMLFTSNTNNLSLESNIELHVFTGDTYDPGGTVTTAGTGNVHVDDNSTADFDTPTNTIAGDVLVDTGATLNIDADTAINGGALTGAGTATIAYTGTPTLTMSGTGSMTAGSGGFDFYDLTTSGSGTTTLASTINIDNDLTIGAGTTFSMGANDINIGGSLSIANTGVYTKGSGTITFDGSGTDTITDSNASSVDLGIVSIDGSSKVINLGSSAKVTSIDVNVSQELGLGSSGYTLEIAGSGQTTSRPFIVDGTLTEGSDSTVKYTGTATTDIQNETYHDLEIDYSGTTFNLMGDTAVAGILTNTNGELDASSYTLTLSGTGTPFVNSDTFTPNSSTVSYTGQGATNITNVTYNNLHLKPDGGSQTYTLPSGTLTVNGTVDVGDGVNTVEVTGATNNPTMNFSKLQINTNGTFTTGTGTLTISGSGTGVSRPLYINSGTFTATSGNTTIFTGSSASEIDDATYHNLSVHPGGAVSHTTLAGTITVNGDLSVGDGSNAGTMEVNTNDTTLSVAGSMAINPNAIYSASSNSANALTIGDDFTNNGTFTNNAGKIVFNNASNVSTLTYSGATTFGSFEVITANKEIQFDNADQTTITGNFTIDGSACGTYVVLTTDSGTNAWEIDLSAATVSVDYADINYSTEVASSPDPTATNSVTTYGNNTGWNRNGGVCAFDLTGNVYNEGTSSALSECADGAGGDELKLRFDAATYTTSCADATGYFNFESIDIAGAGTIGVVWIDDDVVAGTDGALVMRYDGAGNSDNNVFYDDQVTLTSDDTNPLTIVDMDTYDSANDADIPYTATDSAPDTLVVASGYDLHVKINSAVTAGSDVFDPGGTITTQGAGDFHLDDDSDAYFDTATNTIAGDVLVDAGATMNFDANTTITGGDITVTGDGVVASGGGTVTMGATGTIGGGTGTFTLTNLTVSSGTTTLGAAASSEIDILGDVSVSTGATLEFESKTLDIDGGNLTTVGTGAVTCSGCSGGGLLISGDGTTNGIGGGGDVTLYSLTLDGSTNTTDVTSTLNVLDEITIGANRTLDLNSNDLTVGSTVTDSGTISVTGTITAAGGTTTIQSSDNSTVPTIGGSGSTTLYNLDIGADTDNLTYTIDTAGDITVSNVLTIQDAGASDTHTFDASNDTITLAGSGTPFVPTDTFTPSSSTVEYVSTGATNVVATTYYNLSLVPNGAGSPTFTLGTSGDQTISTNNNLTVGDGTNPVTVNWTTYDPTLNIGGNLTLSNNTTWTKSDSATLTFNGATTPVTWTDSNGTKQDMGLVDIDGPKEVDLASSVAVTKLDVTSGDTLDLGSSGNVLTITGSGQTTARPLIVGGTLTEGTDSTVKFSGTGTTDIEAETYHDLTLDQSGTIFYLSGNTEVGGVATITNGTMNASSHTLTLSGGGTPFVITDTFTPDSSTVKYTSTSATNITSTTYNILELQPSGAGSPTYTMQSGTVNTNSNFIISDGTNPVTVDAETNDPIINVDGSFTNNTNGTFNASTSSAFTIANDFTNNGTFTANSGTLTLDTAATATLLYSAATTFYNLYSDVAGKTIEFDNVDATNIASGGLLTLQGTSCASQDIFITSDTGIDQFELNIISGASTNIDFADIEYMNATGTAITADQSLDSGNNTSVTFPNSCTPQKVAFTNASRTLTAGACNGAANVFTMELQNNEGTARTPSGSTDIRVSSNSPEYTIYSDDTCSTEVTPADFTYSTSDTSKSVYIIDTRKSVPTWTITGTKQSGPDTISAGNQTYTIDADTVVSLVITLPGETFTDGVGNSGTADLNGGSPGTNAIAGTAFDLVSISAVDQYHNVNDGYTGSKNLTWSNGANYPGDAPNTTPPDYPTSATFTMGQATSGISVTLYDDTLTDGDPTVALAVDDSGDGGDYSLDSTEFSVEAGAISAYDVNIETPQTAGVCFTGTNEIIAWDAYENKRTTDTSLVNITTNGTSITFYDGGDCLSSTTTYTLSGGDAVVYMKTNLAQSGFTITATRDGGVETGESNIITVDPAPVNAILVKLPGQTFVDGTGITGSPSFSGLRTTDATAGTSFDIDLKAVDEFNNLVDNGTNNYNGSKTISFADSIAGDAPDTQSPSFPVSPIVFTNGEANGLTLTYYLAATNRTVEADDTVTPVSGTTSSTFEVKPGDVENYEVISATSSQVAGVAFNVTIKARDDWHNELGSLYTAPAGTYVFTTTAGDAPDTTSPSIGTLVQGDFSSGEAVKSVTLYKAESGVTFTAEEPGPSSVAGTSTSVDIDPGDVSADSSDSSVTASPSGYVGYDHTVTITLKDTWRNPVSGVPAGDITIGATSNSTITGPFAATDASGVTTGSVAWGDEGSKTVDVTIGGTTTLVQNDGITPDADGRLDDTQAVDISYKDQIVIEGGTTFEGGSQLSE